MSNIQSYRKSFPAENIYIHNHFDSQKKKWKYKYVYIWRALTPTGKVSKYSAWIMGNKEDCHKDIKLPKLRKGYEWKGPYLYGLYEYETEGAISLSVEESWTRIHKDRIYTKTYT